MVGRAGDAHKPLEPRLPRGGQDSARWQGVDGALCRPIFSLCQVFGTPGEEGGGGAGWLDREPLEVDGGREGGPEAGGRLMLLGGVAPSASAPFCEDLRVSGDETLTLFAADGGTAG